MKNYFMKSCLICNNFKQQEELHVLNLTETFCFDCLMNEINLRTNNLVILNDYEKGKKIFIFL